MSLVIIVVIVVMVEILAGKDIYLTFPCLHYSRDYIIARDIKKTLKSALA